jgi:putative membrane protein (TIGR04086 family)
MRNKIMPVAVGALATLALGAIALAVLSARYHGNVPLLPAVLAVLLCSLSGGYLATRLAQVRGLTTGALSGLIAGLGAVAWTALVAKGMYTTPAIVLAPVICVVGGALGGWLTRVRLSVEKGQVEV